MEIDQRAAKNIARIFQLYAYENQTLEGGVRKLAEENAIWREVRREFIRTSIHNILNDRAYIGEVQFREHWHPWHRVREAELDLQVLQLSDRMRIQDEAIKEWFQAMLASKTKDDQAESIEKRKELQRQFSLVIGQQDRLLNLHIEGEIEQETFLLKQV